MPLEKPPSLLRFNAVKYGPPQPDHIVSERLAPLLAPEVMANISLEIREEIEHVVDPKKTPGCPWYHDHKVYWMSATGDDWLHRIFPELPSEIEGMHKCLQWIVDHTSSRDDWEELGEVLEELWQGVWTDAMIELYPSPYAVFIRSMIMPLVPEDERETWALRVRDSAIEVERDRQNLRLDRALLTPHVVSRQRLMNGLHICWADLLDPEEHDTRGLLSQRQRAAFVVAMLMLGSRFKGVAVDNTYTIISGKPAVWLSGLSKSKDATTTVRRPINLDVAGRVGPTSKERMGAFVYAFYIAREGYHATHRARGGDEDIGSVRQTLNVMRKEVKRYIETVFPGLLRPGESTHLLRKIYLQLAFKTYGTNMKETGFAAKVFAHEGYATALHYTSVILST